MLVSEMLSEVPGCRSSHQFLHLTLENIFEQVFPIRLQADNQGIGHRDDKIIYETGHVGGDKLILDGSSSAIASNTPSNISILLEEGSQPSGYDYDVAYLILTQVMGSMMRW